MKNHFFFIAILASSLFVGCGGGSSTPTTQPPTQSSSSSSEPAPAPSEKASLLIMANLDSGYVMADYIDVQLVGQSIVSEELNPVYLSMPRHPIVPWVVLSGVEVGEYTAILSLYRYNRETDEPELIATGQGDFIHVVEDSVATIDVSRTIPVPPMEPGIGGMFQDHNRNLYEVKIGADDNKLTLTDLDARGFTHISAADVDQDGYLVGTLRQKMTNGGSDGYVMRIDPYYGDYDVLFDAEERLIGLAVNVENDVFALSWYDAWLEYNGEKQTQTLYHFTMDGTLVSQVVIDRLINGIDFHPDGRLIGLFGEGIYSISIDTGETSLLYEYEYGGGRDIDISSSGILRMMYSPTYPEIICNSCVLWREINLENGEILKSALYDDHAVMLISPFLIYY